MFSPTEFTIAKNNHATASPLQSAHRPTRRARSSTPLRAGTTLAFTTLALTTWAALALAQPATAHATSTVATAASTPTAATLASAPELYQLPISDRIYEVTRTSGTPKATWITHARWAALGYAKPRVVNAIPGTQYFKYMTSNEVFFGTDIHKPLKLNFDQWVRVGAPTPTNNGMRVIKPQGAAATVLVPTTGAPTWLTWSAWQDLQMPTAAADPRFGDLLYLNKATSEILFWTTPSEAGTSSCPAWIHLTSQQWSLMGNTWPTATTAPWNRACA